MPEECPFLLRILNKPLLEFLIDFCVTIGVDAIRIVQDTPDRKIAEYFSDGKRWGLDISFGTMSLEADLNSLIEHNHSFLENDSLLFLDGFTFINYNINNSQWDFLNEKGAIYSKEGNIKFAWIKDSGSKLSSLEEYVPKSIAFTCLDSVGDYYDLSQKILADNSSDYVLPGYNNDPGIFLGQNVEIAQNANIRKPVIIADQVRIRALCMIGPGAVIGSNVLLDSSCSIENSIIYDHTYIGSDLEISRKIIYHNKVIDPETSTSTDIVDAFLISETGSHGSSNFVIKSVQAFFAVIIIALMFIPYFLLRLFTKVKKLHKIVFVDREKHIHTISVIEPYDSLGGRLFYHLSLDRFPLLFNVISGHLYLVGNTPLSNSNNHVELLHDLPVYHPAVFTFTDTVDKEFRGEFEDKIHELFYSNNSKFILDINIVIKILFKRLLFRISDGELQRKAGEA